MIEERKECGVLGRKSEGAGAGATARLRSYLSPSIVCGRPMYCCTCSQEVSPNQPGRNKRYRRITSNPNTP